MGTLRFRELTGWTLAGGAGPDGQALIVLLVEDDAELAAALAAEADGPGERFAGAWRAGERDGTPIVSLVVLEDADGGLERAWWTGRFDRPLLEAIARVPHQVAVVPRSTVAALPGGHVSLTALRAGEVPCLRLEVDHPSARVAELLAEAPEDAG